MKYYAIVSDGQLEQVGTGPKWLASQEQIELTVEQASSLLSGKTSWRDWAVIDGTLVSVKQVDHGVPKFANLLVRATPSASAIFVTEKDNPLALYDTIAGWPTSQSGVSLWQKKKRT